MSSKMAGEVLEITSGKGLNGYHPQPVPQRADAVISVRGLSKSFLLGQSGERPTTAAEAIMQRLRNPFARESKEAFWALRGIDLDIFRGDVVGVIGRNGAGKSTFLKVLSRITEPTTGRIELHGRVGSLLEVGTGFHPELTGRENIYLNGAILGMTRREIDRRFDEIVAFSETERFLDTPVKRYSSGMAVRLAFAVAANLDTEILIVDEVLAVGDAQFQKKCLGKMKDVAGAGRTVLFVSHSMATVLQLCSRAVILKQGKVFADGGVESVVREYLDSGEAATSEILWRASERPGNDFVHLDAVRVRNAQGEIADQQMISEPVTFELDFTSEQERQRLNFSLVVTDPYGSQVFGAANFGDSASGQILYDRGRYRIHAFLPPHLLNDLHYKLSLHVFRDNHWQFHTGDLLDLNMVDDAKTRGDFTGPWPGMVRPILPWRAESLENALTEAIA